MGNSMITVRVYVAEYQNQPTVGCLFHSFGTGLLVVPLLRTDLQDIERLLPTVMDSFQDIIDTPNLVGNSPNK